MHKSKLHYYHNYYLKQSIYDILINNSDVVEESAEILVFTSSQQNQVLNLPDNVQVYIDHLQIKPKENLLDEMQQWIQWDQILTILIYKKPIGINAQEILRKGKEAFIYEWEEQKSEKKNIDPEWEFIYQVQPDVFLSKKNNSVMIGSLTNRTLIHMKWNMPSSDNKADLIDIRTYE